jgi:hypothetical protein
MGIRTIKSKFRNNLVYRQMQYDSLRNKLAAARMKSVSVGC